MRFLIVAVAALVIGAPARAATISTPGPCGASGQPCPAVVTLSGAIEPGDDETLRYALAGANLPRRADGQSGITLQLDSPGGDVQTAMAIGRIVREARATTSVPQASRCASACVLILGAGVVRAPILGTVVIHRPFFGGLSPGLSSSHVQQRYRDMRRRIDDYAFEMNLPNALIELMFSVPPERERVLARAELGTFALDGYDPVYEEQHVARLAHTWGITNAEVRGRQARMERTCRSPATGDQGATDLQWADHNACRLMVLVGMPLQAARQAVARAFPDWPAAPIPWTSLAALAPETVAARTGTCSGLPPVEDLNCRIGRAPFAEDIERVRRHVAPFRRAIPIEVVRAIQANRDIAVRVRVQADAAGAVTDVQAEDQVRYRSDPHFRSIVDWIARTMRDASPLPLPSGPADRYGDFVISFDLGHP